MCVCVVGVSGGLGPGKPETKTQAYGGNLWMETQVQLWGTLGVERMESRPETWRPRDRDSGPGLGEDLGSVPKPDLR